MQTFVVTYQMPGKPVVTDRGVTEHGVRLLMNAVLLGGGWGTSMEASNADASKDRSRRRDQFAAAVASNKHALRASHDAYLIQMPRARGYAT